MSPKREKQSNHSGTAGIHFQSGPRHAPLHQPHLRQLRHRQKPLTSTACTAASSPSDATFIRHCVALDSHSDGQTRLNPVVRRVLTSHTGAVLAEGFHRRAGRRHPEAVALFHAAENGLDVRGATSYALEPCNLMDRTPLCSAALIAAGVSRVVVGEVDPDPRTVGRGVQRMRDTGIEVLVGVGEASCRRLNEGFVRRAEERVPFGVLKYAMTLDEKTATRDSKSKPSITDNKSLKNMRGRVKIDWRHDSAARGGRIRNRIPSAVPIAANFLNTFASIATTERGG